MSDQPTSLLFGEVVQLSAALAKAREQVQGQPGDADENRAVAAAMHEMGVRALTSEQLARLEGTSASA